MAENLVQSGDGSLQATSRM